MSAISLPRTQLIDKELEDEHALAIARARGSMLGFIKHVNPNYEINWHHAVLCRLIDRMMWGDLRRVIISLPPRAGKSEIFSRALPGYILGHNPDDHIIACSYGAELAQRMNRDAQRIIDSDAYREAFPDTQLFGSNVRTVAKGSYLRNSDIFEIVNHRGQYRCAGVGGPITGSGGRWLLGDDLIRNAEDASSETILTKQWEWYVSTFRTRAAHDARIAIVMTRWVDTDIPGRLITQMGQDVNADQFLVVNLPAINVHGPSEFDPRQVGEPLWPKWFPLKSLLAQKAAGSRIFQAMYQGDPVPPGGNIVQEKYFRRYRQAELPTRWEKIMIAADLTFDDKKKGDWNVMVVMGLSKGQVYLLARVRRQMPFTEQCSRMLSLYEDWCSEDTPGHGVYEVAVEKAANGTALVDRLREHIPCIVAVPVPGRSKVSRAEAITPIIEAGNFFVPHEDDAPWVSEFLAEWTRFPHGKHDDQVDATVLGINRLLPPKRNRVLGAAPVGIPKGASSDRRETSPLLAGLGYHATENLSRGLR